MKLASRSILIAEDHDDSRLMLRMLLEKQGFLVIAAADCDQALVFAQSMKFDLCILDHCLGDGDVTQLREELRRLHPEMPALYYTGVNYSAEEIKELRRLGDEYLIKPAEITTIVATVNGLLQVPPE